MKDISLEQYNLRRFGSITAKNTLAECKTENDFCKDIQE